MKKIIEFSRQHDLFRPGMKVLCAVSGGADSMCLLHWFVTHADQLGVRAAAAHYNHALRGEESERDERFVKEWCAEHSVEFMCERGDVSGYAAAHGLGIEEAARILRYEFLQRASISLSCDRIATAHNLSDNAETVLFHLARGAGIRGLSGIAPARENIIRPLLCLSREEIEAYLEENGVPHVEDSTNALDDCTRNRIRHRLLPELTSLNGEFARAVLRTGELLRADDTLLNAQAEKFIEENYDGESVPAKELNALPVSLSSRVIRMLCPKELSFDQVSAVLKCAGETERRRIDLPGLRLSVEQGRVFFRDQSVPETEDTELLPGTEIILPGFGIRVQTEISVFSGKIHGLFKPFCFKCDEIYGRIFLTGRRDGDRIRPQGRGCTKTLKKLYAEAGLTARQRVLTPVLRDEKGVLAVCGLAVGERAAPSPGDRIVQITIQPLTHKSEKETNGQNR